MKKYIFLLVFAVSAIAYTFYYTSKLSPREIFQNKIQKELAHFQDNLPQEETNEKALGQPDMAALQDYYQTLDPAENRVPQERLWKAHQQMQEMQLTKRDDLELDWQNIPSDMGGRTRTVMWDPNSDNMVWAGSVTGGIWYNTDITSPTSQWQAVDDFMSSLSVSSLCYDPNNTQIFYAGTGEAPTAIITYRESSGRGVGIWKSINGGDSWNLLESTLDFAYINDIKVRDENGNSVIYAAVASGKYMGEDHNSQPNDGLYRSTDNGQTWTQVLPNISGLNIPFTPDDIEFGADGRIYIGSMRNIDGNGGASILFSDEGTTGNWTVNETYKEMIENGIGQYYLPGRTMLAPAPSDENIVYAIIGAGYENGFGYYHGNFVLKSTDKGQNWTEMNLPDDPNYWASLSWHAYAISVDPNNANHFYVGGLDEYHSLNGGNSYTHISDWAGMYDGGGNDYIHADQHCIAFKPGSSDEIIFASDGGVFYTENGANSYPIFKERNHYYSTLQFYTAAIHPQIMNHKHMGGLQDNGTLLYQGEPLDINDMIMGGDGAYCFYDKNDASVSMTSYYYNRYQVYENGDEGVGNAYDNGTGTFISPADFDSDNNILYGNGIGFFGQNSNTLFRAKNIPNNFTINMVATGTDINTWYTHIAYSPYSELGKSTLFVGSQAGHLFKIEEAQDTPESANIGSNDFPIASVSCVAIGGSEDTLLVTFSNYGVSSIWQTYNGGSSWQEKEGNLPDMPVRWAIYHPQESTQAIIATELGVWTCDDLTVENPIWQPNNQGMANVRVDMLQLREADLEVLAATHGRGLYTTTYDFINVGIQNEISDLEVSIGPNPSYGIVNIHIPNSNAQNKNLNIYNLQGQLVYSNSFNKIDKSLELSHLPKSIYMIDIEMGEQHYTEKISLK